MTVTLTDDTQNEPPEKLTSSVTVTSADESVTELGSGKVDYTLKDFLEEKKKDVAIAKSDDLIQDIYWIDKDDTSNRPDKDVYKQRMKLAFCILEKGQSKDEVSDENYIKLTAENMKQVGLTDINNLIKIAESGNHWQATANLPTSIHYGDDPNNSREVVWRMLPPEEDIPNYTWWDSTTGQDPGKEDNWYYLLEEPFTFTVNLRNGEEVDPDEEVIRQLILNNFSLYYKATNVVDGTGTINLAKLLQQDSSLGCNVEKDGNGNYIVKITGLGTYTVNGDRVQYAVQHNDEEVDVSNIKLLATGIGDEGDWLTVEYKTQGVNNEKVFDGDTMVLTLQGHTTYTANKDWMDMGDTEQRPSGYFELWRYRPGKETWDQASPVRGADGQILTVQLDTANKTQVIDFNTQLDKYGPEGYEYVYICKEVIIKKTTANYEQVFGKVGKDGKVTDTLPQGMTERETGNIYIYENGTLTNRITASRTISATKRWEASSFQSELKEFVVELQLYSRPKDSPDGTEWNEVEGKVLTMKDFTSEKLEQSASMSVPTYNEHGQELEYKFEEEKVYLKDDPQTNLLVIDEQTGEQVIRWNHNGQTVTFASELQEDGTIVNKLKDTIEYDFTKVWTGGWTADDLKGISDNGGVTFTLYYHGKDGKNYTVIEEIKLDGKADDPAQTHSFKIGEKEYTVTVQEQGALPKEEIGENDAHWPVHIEGLPRYDEDGYQIEYFVFENNENDKTYVADYNIEHAPDTGNYTGKVTNPHGTGGHRILVRKRWIDDSDLSHREDVIITAYYHMGEGKDDVKLGSVELKSNGVGMDYIYFDDEALKTAGITDGNYDASKVYVLETKVGGIAPVTDGKAVEKDGQYLGETNKVYANFHDYEITYSILKNGEPENIADEDVYVVTNRRLGSIDITATKIWQDGGKLREVLQKENITPVLVLEFTEQDQSYVEKGDYFIDYGKNTVTLGGEEMQIQDKNGTDSKAILPLSLEGADTTAETYYFCNLPKYNVRGEVAHYTITEMWYQGTDTTISIDDCVDKKTLIGNLGQATNAELIELLNDCDSSIQPGEYKNGHDDNNEDTDSQEMKVTNRLSGTKTVSFHKTWKDHYVYRILQKRPDIYLTLYQLNNDTNQLKVVEPYKDRVWTEFMEGTVWPEYQWSCHFRDLPKYDEEGREIFYYATERMAADGANFDYKPVELSHSEAAEGATKVDGKDWKRTVVVDGENEEAVLEGGTFTNRLEAPAKISGVKLWDNLPSLWKPENLPTVTFTITCNGVLDNNGNTTGTSQGGEIASITIDTGVWTSALRTDFKFTQTGDWKMGADGKLIYISGDKKEIPKYNDKGQQYNYTLTEEIKFKDETVSKDQVFSEVVSNGYQIKNEYNPTLGAIQVKKLLQVGKDWKQYPAVTIELVRKYTTNGEDYHDDNGFTMTQTWDADKVAEAAAAQAGTGTVVLDSGDVFTFENLPIYQPNGYEYQYYVREKVDGYLNYESGVKGGDVKVGDFVTIFPSTATDGKEDGNYLRYNTGLEPTENVNGATAPDLEASATFGDKYEPESIKLTGKKAWEDQNNALELRPSLEEMKSKFKLYRWAPAQPDQPNGIGTANNPIAVPEQNFDGTTWTWTNTGETSNTWTYEITGLEKFAPNGMEWKYVVKEDMTGLTNYCYYPKSASVSGSWSKDEKVYKMDDLTNSLKINLNFSKEWQEKDGTKLTNDYLGLDKITITGELYVAEGDGALRPASEYFTGDVWAEWFGNGYEFTKDLTTTIGGTQTEKFENLPRVNQDEEILYYAVAETKITAGGLTQEYTVQVDGRKITYVSPADGALGGLFTPQNISSPSGATTGSISIVMRNTMPTQELNVEKKWTDEFGADLTTDLPTEVNLVVQRQSSASAGNWTNVTDGDGNPLVVTLKSSGFWKATISKLPTNGIENDKVVTYTYRARELKADWTEGSPVEENDILDTDAKFGSEFTVSYDDTNGTIVTNKRTHMTLTAEKQWKPSAPSKDDEVTLILYQRPQGGTDDDWKPFTYEDGTSAEVKLNGTVGTENDTCYASDKWIATWKNLPRADENGILYEYKVEETVDELKDNLFGSVTPETIASDSTDKKFIVTNLPMGQLHIEKKDGDGNALEGVVFELQYKDSTGNWLPIDKNVCKAETVNARQTTGEDGKVSYTHLLLTDENGTQISYQIVEVSTPDGYNRLTSPIPVSFETTDKPADPYWTITGGYLASEVTYTVHNNQYFQTINTGAGGFFWPGVAGAGAACAGVWYLAGRKRRKHNKRHSDR